MVAVAPVILVQLMGQNVSDLHLRPVGDAGGEEEELVGYEDDYEEEMEQDDKGEDLEEDRGPSDLLCRILIKAAPSLLVLELWKMLS